METVGPSNQQALACKSVVITGASGGIGRAIAIGCANAGATTIGMLARSLDALEATAREVRLAGSEAITRACDVTDTAALVRSIGAVKPVDVLVNCAGVNKPEPFVDVTAETFDSLWNLNVKATFFASQAVAQRMLTDRRPGVIVNISSQMGHVGAVRRSAYCTTKHAVEGLTKALAVELAPHGIRVVSIAPTFVRTAMTASQLDDPATRDQLLGQIPLGRFAVPEEVAAAVVFAASDCAAMMTGSSLGIDGGWTAQ